MDSVVLAPLAHVLPPSLGVDEQIDWPTAEARWGTRFPQDYMAFMSVYGAGSIGDGLGILMPLPKEYIQWDPGTLEDETANARLVWEKLGDREGTNIEPDHILAWGSTSGADILCWLTAGADPDSWPVLVCGRHTRDDFTVFPFGMVEFLRRLLLKDIDPHPISIDLGNSPGFVHWLEEQRRFKAGLDPYTGEPDPDNRYGDTL
ncbi:SMI1/KNR4 family protein [Streptomyces sp. NPDC004838]